MSNHDHLVNNNAENILLIELNIERAFFNNSIFSTSMLVLIT